ncbi:MAG: hypothetical protein FWE23_03820 [Chitinivibrionia bacterium]|nr:hypothetical protein [Chitinivibrionia bacterium]
MKTINKDGITYIGGDIVEKIVENNNELYGNESISFKVLDITEDDLPKVDMILCRDCLCHLSNENVLKALRNFKKSGAKYLLATSYPLTSQNWDINNGDFRPINLLIEPFNLPHPISKIHNGFIGIPSNYETDKTEYLFDLKDIGGIL